MSVHLVKSADQIHAAVVRDLEASTLVPLLQIVLLITRKIHQHGIKPDDGATGLVAAWGELAAQIVSEHPNDFGTPGELSRARVIAQRAVRVIQGYGSEAEARGVYVGLEFLKGAHGLDRTLSHEEEDAMVIAIGRGLVAYHSYLDHGCGGLTPTRGA